MEQLWVENSAHGRFWRQLLRDRAAQIVGDEAHLRRLRYLPDLVKSVQRKFGHIWADANTNIYKLIAGAFGEVWDEEDDEKQQFAAAHAGKKEAAVKQREPQESLEDLEEKGKGRQEGKGEEGGEGRSRREEFYRRAGSTC